MNSSYDVIIAGAGSIGVPAALALAACKNSVLVIDSLSSPGQENNKKAIGGIRATHSDFGKIKLCQRSIEIFSTWQECYGDDIGWQSNGYSFPAYSEDDEKKLRELMKIQHEFGLKIKWLSAEEYSELVPGVFRKGLRGSTYSWEDGSASPLLAINAFYFRSVALGARYHFRERIIGLTSNSDRITGVITNKGSYNCRFFVNAAGNFAREIGNMAGLTLPVNPDNHEAGITEPVLRFFEPMIVDMRKETGSANFYFYQNKEGQVVFCITPDPPITGIDNRATAGFLPLCSRRMISIYPRLRNLKVRRTWRGQYPMTADGFPIVGPSSKIANFINAVGMCGQGFMLGPGIGELIARLVYEDLKPEDQQILTGFSADRDFRGMEQFK
ncbi:MAG: FAD-binding oxidoreductase [Candidatus Cloacimonetes bacterium]|nr:FAD-binding oxidoreductase [Candidatus Cloacimonadota bacterium]